MGKQVALHGKYVSRCGRQAVLLDSAHDLIGHAALISGYESRRSPYRETVACPQGGEAMASLPKVSASTLSKLTGKRLLAFHG